MLQRAIFIDGQFIHHQLKQRGVGDAVCLVDGTARRDMGIIVGLLAGQAVISEEVAGLAHVLAWGDVTSIVEVAHSRGVLFHRLFADEHGDGLERAVLHTRYITLHGQRGQSARHQPNCSPLGGFHRVTDEHANAVVGLLVQIFHCAVLVAAAFQDDEKRSIE